MQRYYFTLSHDGIAGRVKAAVVTDDFLPVTASGLLQPHLERVAVSALQLCCLLLPPPNRRKLQLLMRMMARMSGNVDLPILHDAMGTRALVSPFPVGE